MNAAAAKAQEIFCPLGKKWMGKVHRHLDILRKEPARAKRCHAGKEKKRKAQKWKNTQKGIFFV